MLSTANATWDRPLTHTRMLGRFVVAATIKQGGTPGGVPKTRCLAYQQKPSHTLTHVPVLPPIGLRVGSGQNKRKQQSTTRTIATGPVQKIRAKSDLPRKGIPSSKNSLPPLLGSPRYATAQSYLLYVDRLHLIPRRPAAIGVRALPTPLPRVGTSNGTYAFFQGSAP